MAECIHPLLGTIRGRRTDNVVQFLGIPYATIKERLGPPIPIESPRNGNEYVVDATAYGPDLVGAGSCTDEQDLIQHRLPYDPLIQSVLDVLRLNITVPVTKKGLQRWPVMVFVHGGNFAGGSPVWPQNDLARFVQRSQTLGMPLIGVSISYRVGPAGFLTSEELRHHGLTGNNGLRDQAAALLWLRNHLEGFWGDPDNITLVGQFAGAVSGMLHLASNVPLFKRLACLGGQFLAVRPLPAEAHEEIYTRAVPKLGLENLSPSERVRRFEGLSREELLDISFLPSCPIIDGKVCTAAPSFASLRNGSIPRDLDNGWCSELFIGDCEFEASILARALDHRRETVVITRFVDKLRAAIPVTQHHLLDEIVDAYGLGKHVEEGEEEGTHENRARNGFLCLIHDIMFYAPAEIIASAWPAGRSYLYHFNEPNPWPGRWQGHASHLTDLAFLLQNYEEALAPASRQVSRHFSADLISFINGRAPWTAYRAAESSPPMARIYGPSDNGSVAGVAVARSGACGRRQSIWKFIEKIGADLLYDVVMGSLL